MTDTFWEANNMDRDWLNNPDYKILADLSNKMRTEYEVRMEKKTKAWETSPFKWLLTIPSRTIGMYVEHLVEGWCKIRGFDVHRSPDAEADRIINGHRIEIKSSTLWESGLYKFQQIRDQNYNYCFCLGLSPLQVHAWLIPKSELQEPRPSLQGQHGGKEGVDTKWLGIAPDNPPEWLVPYGDRLEKVAELLKQAGRGYS